MTGGSLGVTGNTVVGSGAAATFTQDNSAADSYHSVGGSLILGAQAGGSGSYSLTDTGSGYAASLSVTGDTIVGDAGSGSFTQSGAASVHTTTNLILGNQAGGSGTYNLSGGSLSASTMSTSAMPAPAPSPRPAAPIPLHHSLFLGSIIPGAAAPMT